jgi:hypothetical protein
MSVSVLEEQVGEAPAGSVESPVESTSRRAGTRSARDLLPRAYDALVVVWLVVFHHVLGVKYRFAQIAYDEHYFLAEGWSVLKGQIPYRDFQEFKPPVIFFVHALGLELFGLEGLGYRKFLALLSLASFLALTVALLSRRVHRLIVVAAVMLMIDHFYDDGLHNGVINDAETLALDFFLLGSGVLLARTKWQRTQLVLGGVLLALSPLSKEPMAFAAVLAWLSLLLLYRVDAGTRNADSKSAAKQFASYTVAGAAAVAATWLVYMLATGSLSWYILQLKLSFAYTENYAYQLRWASRAPPGGVLAETFRRLQQGYVNAAHLAVFIPFFVALLTLPRRMWVVALGAVATFAASLYAVSVGGGFATRYFIMAMTGVFLCVTLGAAALDAFASRWRRDLSPWVGAACMALALVTTWPRFAAEWGKYGGYQLPPAPAPPVVQADVDFVREHTRPTDTIFTIDDPLLFVYSDRLNAFRGGIVLDEIIEYYPGNTDEERLSVIRTGLEEKRPKLVVLTHGLVSARRKRRYMKALVSPFLRDHGYIRLNERFYLRPD